MNQGQLLGAMTPGRVMAKSIYINQLVGGYTLTLQGDNFHPQEVYVTIEEVQARVASFFTQPESDPNETTSTQPESGSSDAETVSGGQSESAGTETANA